MPNACNLCDSSFSIVSSLYQHLDQVHNTGKSQCQLCKMGFPSKTLLEYHVPNCTGRKISVINFTKRDTRQERKKSALKVNFVKEESVEIISDLPKPMKKLPLPDFSLPNGNMPFPNLPSPKFLLPELILPNFNEDFANLQNISNIHTPESCPECGKLLANKKTMRIHMLKFHRMNGKDIFQCRQCRRKFLRKFNRDFHEKNCQMRAPYPTVSTEKKEFPTFFCQFCTGAFGSKIEKKIHENICQPSKIIDGDPLLDREIQNQPIPAYAPIIQEKLINLQPIKAFGQMRYFCQKCKKDFESPPDLVIHIKNCFKNDNSSTSTNSLLKCSKCNFVGKKRSATITHERYCKKNQRKCELCPKAFKTLMELSVHICSKHAKTDFLCGRCGEPFSTEKNMNNHFILNICRFQFTAPIIAI